jgi:hypothetical protein
MCIEYQVPSSIGFRKACNFVRTTSHIKDPADPVSFRVESPGGSERMHATHTGRYNHIIIRLQRVGQ